MKQFVDSIRAAVNQGNWYAALATALTLPDICGRIEDPAMGRSKTRFVNWYDQFLLHRYQGHPGGTPHTFLSGSDCYALRCAFLHQGEFGIDDQHAQEVLEHFRFTAPRKGSLIHMNQANNVLQIQVDRFCLDVCEGVEQWLASVACNADIQSRLAKLAVIA